MKIRWCLVVGLSLLGYFCENANARETITIDPAVTLQTMRGWEVTSFVADSCDPLFETLRDAYVDLAVNDIGIDRVRLEVRSGAENNVDYYAMWVADGCPGPPDPNYQIWRDNRYATVNDNVDHNDLNPGGFHFTELDWNVENVILPMKQQVEANGEHLVINLNYVAFTSQIQGGGYHHGDPDEYAEFVLATYQHLQGQYGLVPDTWELVLEPDNVTEWNGTLLGQAIVATAEKLQAAGFTPRFVAPSNTNMSNAITYFDQMIAVPGALSFLEEFSYHRYGGVSIPNLQAIANRAVQNNLSTGMLEWWFDNGTFEVLHEDLTIGRNSSWQGSVLSGLFNTDTSDPENVNISYRTNTQFNRQYFKYIRQGALRIDAESDGNLLNPIAFINPGGRHVVVLKADAGAPFSINGLPAGQYGITYTTATEYSTELSQVNLSAGSSLTGTMPDEGVLTVFAVGAQAIPTTGGWGAVIMTLALALCATLVLRCRVQVQPGRAM